MEANFAETAKQLATLPLTTLLKGAIASVPRDPLSQNPSCHHGVVLAMLGHGTIRATAMIAAMSGETVMLHGYGRRPRPLPTLTIGVTMVVEAPSCALYGLKVG